MQTYNEITNELTGKDLPGKVYENMQSLKSDFSGTEFPTTNLIAGMAVFRTDQNKVYRLLSDLQTWRLERDLSVEGGLSARATNDANGKVITSYVAKLESDANNAFVINFYDGNNNKFGSVTIPETKVEIMTGASSSSAGKAGLVPAPSAGAKNRYLNAYGGFDEINVLVNSVNGKTGDVVVDTLPVGTIISYAGNTTPSGFLDCNGASLNPSTYKNLFKEIGTTYGGNGSTTFDLPNLGTKIVSEVSTGDLAVKGNGKTLGLTNGTQLLGATAEDYGGYHGFMRAYTGVYNTNVGNTSKGTGGNDLKSLGITTDGSKSGMVVPVTATKTTVKYCIKY